MVRYHGCIAINGPCGETAQSCRVQSRGKGIGGDEAASVHQIALLAQLVGACIELDLVAKPMLAAGDDKVGTFGRTQLFLQIGLVEPGDAQLAGLIRNSGNGAHAAPACAYVLDIPDEPQGGGDLTEGDVDNFFELAVIAMFTREVEEQVTYGTDAKMMQARGSRCSHAGNSSYIGAQEGEHGVAL